MPLSAPVAYGLSMTAHVTMRTGGRRGLQITLGVLSLIPFASGLAGMVFGSRTLPGDTSSVQPTLDGEYRFVNAFWFAAAPAIWTTLPEIERKTTRLSVLLGTVLLGGVARLWSWRQVGRPAPVFLGVIALEFLGMPAVLAWQRHVVKMALRNSSAVVSP